MTFGRWNFSAQGDGPTRVPHPPPRFPRRQKLVPGHAARSHDPHRHHKCQDSLVSVYSMLPHSLNTYEDTATSDHGSRHDRLPRRTILAPIRSTHSHEASLIFPLTTVPRCVLRCHHVMVMLASLCRVLLPTHLGPEHNHRLPAHAHLSPHCRRPFRLFGSTGQSPHEKRD